MPTCTHPGWIPAPHDPLSTTRCSPGDSEVPSGWGPHVSSPLLSTLHLSHSTDGQCRALAALRHETALKSMTRSAEKHQGGAWAF